MKTKPTVFNYRDYTDALEKIRQLEAEVERLQAVIDNQTNEVIKLRIALNDAKSRYK